MSDTTLLEPEPADVTEAIEPSAEAPTPTTRRTAAWFALAVAIGTVFAALLFAWTITTGSFDFDRRVPFGDDLYDVQARRLFDGRWDMPLSVVAVEGYEHDDKLYMYFGPVPAFLRMPVLAITDVGNGELAQEWMVVGFVVALAAAGCLAWRIRRLVRGDARFGWVEGIAVALGAFAVGTGSTLLYLGSGPWVYHEAILWGIAWSLAAFAAILAWIERPRWWVLALAALFTVLAVGSRLTVAIGPVATLAGLAFFVLLARLWPWARREVGPRVGLPPTAVTWPGGVALAAGAAVPVTLYAWLNRTKFGTLFSVPYDHQLLNKVQQNRPQVLAANDNTLFRLDAIPTALYQYFRPDAIGFGGHFPWIRFPTWKPSVFGDLLYDHRDRTSSIPASMPLLLGLALAGLVVIVAARRRDEGPTGAALRVPLLGAAVAAVPSLAFIFLTQRYLGDFVPLLVLPAIAGFFAIAEWASRRRGWMRAFVAVGAASLVALATFSTLANYGMARDWQSEHLPPEQRFADDR